MWKGKAILSGVDSKKAKGDGRISMILQYEYKKNTDLKSPCF